MKNQSVIMFVLLLVISIPILLQARNSYKIFESYSNYTLEEASGALNPQMNGLVQDIYPPIDKNQLSNNTSSKMWWHYPTFTLGSYDQITNNIRYSNNPDLGGCMPGSMCGAFYHEKYTGSNYVKPLPPLNPLCNGPRVNYYRTEPNLLPFRSNMANILY